MFVPLRTSLFPKPAPVYPIYQHLLSAFASFILVVVGFSIRIIKSNKLHDITGSRSYYLPAGGKNISLLKDKYDITSVSGRPPVWKN